MVIAAVVALALGVGVYRALSANSNRAQLERNAAALLAVELPDINGVPQKLSQYRGKVLFVNFWATWCAPCRDEMPEFIRAQAAQGAKGIQFAGIAVDQADKVQRFAEEIGLNYPTLVGGLGAMELSRQLGNDLMALPFTVVLDRDGRIVHTHLGPLREAELQRLIKQLT
ncbi:MAG TPA: TlpA disulfide reductase family protein [Casimicrobiaceae bacterium]|nr:TlpA disulfide reductase family protein [Casimicrobiaceae bacterium]